MVNFFRNTDPVVPVLFYFDKAEVLRAYEAEGFGMDIELG